MFDQILKKIETRVMEISDQDYRPGPLSAEQVLVGLSVLYGKGVALRRRRYETGRCSPLKLPCPVISIGNLVAGGAGKTPMAMFLAQRLLAMGKKPVVICRGYKGNLKNRPAVVGDGSRVFLDARTAGDEPVMLAGMKQFPVVAGKDRYAAGMLALQTLDVDTVVLDDGFQHLKLFRDLDLVLMDFHRPLGNGRLLPAGRLREPPELALSRISALVFTRSPENGQETKIPQSFAGLPSFFSFHRPVLVHWQGEENPGLSGLRGKEALLFSGIAQNRAFAKTVTGFGVKILDHLEFKDHYRYKMADFCSIRNRARDLNADLILTTEKDWAKKDPGVDFQKPAGVMGVRIAFREADAFDRFIKLKVFHHE